MAQYDYLFYLLISLLLSVCIITIVVKNITVKDACILVLSRFIFMFSMGVTVGLAVKFIGNQYLLISVIICVFIVFTSIFKLISNKVMSIKITIIEIVIIFIKECAVILILMIFILSLYIYTLFLL